MAEQGVPGLAWSEELAGQGGTGAPAGEDHESAAETMPRYERDDEWAALDQSGWGDLGAGRWSPARPRHGAPLGWPQLGWGELADEQRRGLASGEVRAERRAAIRPVERSVRGGLQPQGEDGPMIAGTYSGAQRA